MKDGLYDYDSIKHSIDDDFKSERELCDFIEKNISIFCKEVLNDELKSYKREYNLSLRNKKGNRRLDFFIKTKSNKNVILECKRPYYISELSSSIGQCISYIMLFESIGQRIDSTYIVSTKPDFILPLVIQRFNLPIEFVVMDKSKHIKSIWPDR